MSEVQSFKTPDGSEMVVLERSEYELLVAAADEAGEADAYDRAKAALAAGEDELVPAAVADRLLAGEAPLRVWREHRGLTQSTLAKRAGVPQSVISAIESGRREPSLSALRALARTLNVDLDDLVVVMSEDTVEEEATTLSKYMQTNGSKNVLEGFGRDTVEKWAQDYWQLDNIKDEERSLERWIETHIEGARRQKFLSKSLFIAIGTWKTSWSDRVKGLLENNSEREIEQKSRAAFAAVNKSAAVKEMRCLSGVGTRTAVAMLHWMRPNEFPMWDYRVERALGWPKRTSWESMRAYESFSETMIEHARRLGVNLRTLDRALWTFDKQANHTARREC